MNLKNFYVIVPISNHVRYSSRARLFREFQTHMKTAGVNLVIVELAFGDRPFEFTNSFDNMNVQLRTFDEMWHKENMINIAISRLPADWEYVAWVDADVHFVRHDWALETIHQLQHHMVVQMFQTAIDTGPSGEAMNTFQGFAWCYLNGIPYKQKNSDVYGQYTSGSIYWHPGFAWAARREAIDAMGGLIDKAILGSADHHMAMSFVNMAPLSVPKDINKEYLDYIVGWQDNAEKFLRRDIGYVPGTIVHSWHGKKKNRKYWDRWSILQKNDYSPRRDIRKDWQGLYQLVDDGTPRIISLRDQLRAYFRSRNEDSVDL